MRNHHKPWFADGRRRLYPDDYDRELASLSPDEQAWRFEADTRFAENLIRRLEWMDAIAESNRRYAAVVCNIPQLVGKLG